MENERHVESSLLSKVMRGKPDYQFEFNDIGPFFYNVDIDLTLLETDQLVREEDGIYITKRERNLWMREILN